MGIFTLREHVAPWRACLLSLILVLFLGITFQHVAQGSQGPRLEGIWKVVGVQSVRADGSTTDVAAQESFVIFTDTHYSMSFAVGEKAASPEKQFSMTDSTMLSRYKHIVVNAGTYELGESTLIVHPMFAKTPDFVNGTAWFDLKLSGDRMTLTWRMTESPDGTQQPYFAEGGRSIITLERAK